MQEGQNARRDELVVKIDADEVRKMIDAKIKELNIVDFVGDVAEFHRKFNLEYDGKPRFLPDGIAAFRQKFLVEELTEYETHIHDSDAIDLANAEEVTPTLEGALDALVDLVYVAIGTAHLHGFDFREAWRRVHAANMAKVRASSDGGDSKRGSSFDVVKPPGWVAPSHADLVSDNIYSELSAVPSAG